MKNTDKSAAPGVAATPTESGASPEGNDGEPGAVESIPTEPRNGGVQGDERIRTARSVTPSLIALSNDRNANG